MNIQLDPWQQEILDYEDGDIAVFKGRRIGLTHIMAIKAVEYLKTHHQQHPISQIVCGSISEDQAKVIIAFATMYAIDNYPKLIGTGKHKPTQTNLTLVVKGNARTLIARPCGNTGNAMRAFGAEILMIDESPFMPEPFWRAATALLADFGGRIWMWGTFDGTDNYHYKSYEKSIKGKGRYKMWIKTTEEVFRERAISESWTKERRARSLQFLKDEKEDKSTKWYNQEYMAIAAVDTTRLFSQAWIDSVCILQKGQKYIGKRYMGCDVARMGGDEIAIQICTDMNDVLYHEESVTNRYQLTTTTERQIYELWQMWKVAKVGIDAGSGQLGVSIYDHLTDYRLYPGLNKFNTLAMNARRMIIDKDNQTQRMMKEDYYNNLLSMGEHGEIKLLDDENVRLSLASIQFDYKNTDSDRPRIYGSYDHISDALSLMAYLARKEKTLNIYAQLV